MGADGLKSRLRGALLGDGDPRPWPPWNSSIEWEKPKQIMDGDPIFTYFYICFSHLQGNLEQIITDLVAALRIYLV